MQGISVVINGRSELSAAASGFSLLAVSLRSVPSDWPLQGVTNGYEVQDDTNVGLRCSANRGGLVGCFPTCNYQSSPFRRILEPRGPAGGRGGVVLICYQELGTWSSKTGPMVVCLTDGLLRGDANDLNIVLRLSITTGFDQF